MLKKNQLQKSPATVPLHTWWHKTQKNTENICLWMCIKVAPLPATVLGRGAIPGRMHTQAD